MFSTPSDAPRHWLIVDTTHPDEMRFATAQPASRPRLENIRSVPIAGLPTFTDALQKYERESGQPLKGLECVLAMAGATSGEMLTMVRSRWTITRTGLAALFGHPVQIVNDVAARAWAIRSNLMSVETLRGVGQPSLARPGRYSVLLVEDGVGACTVDIDRSGDVRILETEIGHIDFAPSNEREEKLAKALRGSAPFVSWEKLLTLDLNDPVWRTACPELVESERQKLVSGLFGRLAVNVMHAFGSWQGIMLTGGRAQRLLTGGGRAAFDLAFGQRRDFTRLIIGAPLWRIDQREPVLTGGAEMLAHGLDRRDGQNARFAA